MTKDGKRIRLTNGSAERQPIRRLYLNCLSNYKPYEAGLSGAATNDKQGCHACSYGYQTGEVN